MGTVTNGFPSVTSVLQHLVFKMSFHIFTAGTDVASFTLMMASSVMPSNHLYSLLLPAVHLGLMSKSFLFFKEAPLIIVQACA